MQQGGSQTDCDKWTVTDADLDCESLLAFICNVTIQTSVCSNFLHLWFYATVRVCVGEVTNKAHAQGKSIKKIWASLFLLFTGNVLSKPTWQCTEEPRFEPKKCCFCFCVVAIVVLCLFLCCCYVVLLLFLCCSLFVFVLLLCCSLFVFVLFSFCFCVVAIVAFIFVCVVAIVVLSLSFSLSLSLSLSPSLPPSLPHYHSNKTLRLLTAIKHNSEHSVHFNMCFIWLTCLILID